jgi:Zn-finger nucleic acid-binding protein
MNCPVCGEKLKEIERYGVMIDLCPGCKGCWLDRGELEKIAAMEEEESGTVSGVRDSGQRDPVDRSREYKDRDDDDHKKDHDDHDDRGSWSGGSGYSRPRKRSSLLGDILGGLGGE